MTVLEQYYVYHYRWNEENFGICFRKSPFFPHSKHKAIFYWNFIDI